MSSCFCMGPQNGEPLCPCAMKSVRIKDGRYVIPEKDLGPALEPFKPVWPKEEKCGVCGIPHGHGGLPCPNLTIYAKDAR